MAKIYTDSALAKVEYQAMYTTVDTDPARGLPMFVAAWGLSSLEEFMALPTIINSGSVTTLSNWFAPFLPLGTAVAIVDDVGLADDGYKMFVWGHFSGKCTGSAVFPDGTSLDVTGKEFKNHKWAYKMTFDRTTKKAVLAEIVQDYAELGRLMGCPTYATAAGLQSLYPA